MLSLNVGCGPHYAKGWVNVDVVARPEADINPDVVASIINLPYEAHTVHRLYAGHTLEHLSLQNGVDNGSSSPAYLSTFDAAMLEVRRVLAPDGVAAFVCPDVYRALDWWKKGNAGWDLVDACLEGPDGGIAGADAWDGCFHAWNCHEQRLVELVRRWFPEATPVPMDSAALVPFPVVSRVEWQCAVLTRLPS